MQILLCIESDPPCDKGRKSAEEYDGSGILRVSWMDFYFHIYCSDAVNDA